MRYTNAQLVRLALAMHDRLAAQHANQSLMELPTEAWDQCAVLVRQIRRARLRGWRLAQSSLAHDLRCQLGSVVQRLTILYQQLVASPSSPCMATASDVYHDLAALADEYEELDFDRTARWLAVTTQPIVLQDVYLGPFEIRLDWGQDAYRVIARDPHPAESRANVTHPHVQDELLCEGDGRQAIRQALAQGRYLDFFTLVAGVLRTYNPESPFVELGLWTGRTCSDCGAGVDDDDSYTCHNCQDIVCSECETTCCGCDDVCCAACIGACASCQDNFCRRCLKTCRGCRAACCAGCLDELERCSNCHETNSTIDRQTHHEVATTANASLQPHGLGQAAVPAGRG
jgi:hypothetical protein